MANQDSHVDKEQHLEVAEQAFRFESIYTVLFGHLAKRWT